MITEIQKLIENYWKWLKDRTCLRDVENGWVEITTPYLDSHNDYIQLYVGKDGDKLIITDDGYTLRDLEMCGLQISSSSKREAILELILNGFGVQRREHEILVTVPSEKEFPLKKHNLVQAILAINDMFYLARPYVTSLFLEDVKNWLELHEIRYVPSVKFPGKSGFDHYFDFVIPKSSLQPERIIKAINRPDRNAAESLVFAWLDTSEKRPEGSKALAFLNDRDNGGLKEDILEAFINYEIKPILWSQRENYLEELIN